MWQQKSPFLPFCSLHLFHTTELRNSLWTLLGASVSLAAGFSTICSGHLTTCFSSQTSVSFSTFKNIHTQVETAILIFLTVIYTVQVLLKILYDSICVYTIVNFSNGLGNKSWRLADGRKVIISSSFCQKIMFHPLKKTCSGSQEICFFKLCIVRDNWSWATSLSPQLILSAEEYFW